MTSEEILELSRGERAFMNVISYLSLYEHLKLEQVERFENRKYVIAKLHYHNEYNDKKYIHTISFHRYGQLEELELFLNKLKSAYPDLLFTESEERSENK